MEAEPHWRTLFGRRIARRAGIAREHLIARLHRNTGFPLLAVADVADFHLAAERRARDGVNQIIASLHGVAVHSGDHVTALQSGTRSWAARLHALNHDSIRCAKILQHHRICTLLFLETHANPAARDFAVRDEVVVGLDAGSRGQRKSDAWIAAALPFDRSSDAHHLTGPCHQWPARRDR